MCARAQTVGSHPAQHVRSRGANRQHEQDREAGHYVTYLKRRDRIVPSKDGIRRLRSDLYTNHKQHKPISDVCTRVHTSAGSNCAGRSARVGAGAWRGRARGGTTAAGAWGRPAHRRLKVHPPLLLDAPQQRPARKSQSGHVSAATAQDREVDVLRAHSTRTSTASKIFLAVGSAAPSRLQRR